MGGGELDLVGHARELGLDGCLEAVVERYVHDIPASNADQVVVMPQQRFGELVVGMIRAR